ncbi:hypothetical protein, partial [Bacteroides acidifaciens]
MKEFRKASLEAAKQ